MIPGGRTRALDPHSPAGALERLGEERLHRGDYDGAIAAWKEAGGGAHLAAKIEQARRARRRLLFEQTLAYADRCRREGLWHEAVRGWTDALSLLDGPDPARIDIQKKIRAVLWRRRLRRALAWGLTACAVGAALVAFARAHVAGRDDGRRREADLKLARAAEAERAGDLERALERYADVETTRPGSAAAEAARDRICRIRKFLEGASRNLDLAAQAVREERFAAAREPLRQVLERREFAASKPYLEAERCHPWAVHGDALRKARQALDAGRFAEAEERFGKVLADPAVLSTEIAQRARDGLCLARFCSGSAEGKRLLEQGKLREAREILASANALAKDAGQALTDLTPVDEMIRRQEDADAAWHRVDGIRRLCLRDFPGAAQAFATSARLRPSDKLAASLLAAAGAGRFPDGMIFVPGGLTLVGSLDALEDPTLKDALDEIPPKAVDLEPFFVDRLEVTQREFARFVRATGRLAPPTWGRDGPPAGKDAYPVTDVSWEDASAYAAWAGKRLPTEEEWEAAARASPPPEVPLTREQVADAEKKRRDLQDRLAALKSSRQPPDLTKVLDTIELPRRYPWGDAWEERRCPLERGLRPAGALPAGAGALGVLDMAGNAWEWTGGAYLSYQASRSGPPFREDFRVIRGGSWRGTKGDVRCANRAAYSPGSRFDDVGFRCAASLEQALALVEIGKKE